MTTMIGTNYSPTVWSNVQADMIRPAVIGIQGTIAATSTGVVDTIVADDSLIRGIEMMFRNQSFGDTVSVSVIDVYGVYSASGTVVGTPITNYILVSDQEKQAEYESVCPFKILGGLVIRVSVTTSSEQEVDMGANLILETVLA